MIEVLLFLILGVLFLVVGLLAEIARELRATHRTHRGSHGALREIADKPAAHTKPHTVHHVRIL